MPPARDAADPPEVRVPLSPERIVAAAIKVADDEGLAGLSMRKVASALGYEVMSLYNHVANKDAMLDAMVDAIAAEMPLPSPDGPWKSELREAFIGRLEVFRAHPWVVPIWNTRMPGPSRIASLESTLATLASAGLSPTRADHGFHALGTYLQGFALQEQAYNPPMGELDDAMAAFRDFLNPDTHPAMLAHLDWHIANPDMEEEEFTFVLDLILDGLER